MNYNKKYILAVANVSVFINGIILTILGTVMNYVIDDYNLTLTTAGSIITILNFGLIIGISILGPIIDGQGFKRIFILGLIIVSSSLAAIALTSNLMILRIGCFLIGLGGSIISGVSNTLVADVCDESEKNWHIGLLGFTFTLSAVGLPFIMQSALTRMSYGIVFLSITILMLCFVFVSARIRYPGPKWNQGLPIKEGIGLLKNTTLLFIGFVLFFQSGMETIFANFTTVFIHQSFAVPNELATSYPAYFWIGMLASRAVLTSILRSINIISIIYLSIGIVLSGLTLLGFAHNPPLAIIGLILCGLGLGSGFPAFTMITTTLVRQLSGTAISIIFFIALIGGTSIAFFIGAMSDFITIRTTFQIFIPLFLGMYLLFFMQVARKIRMI
ncbi:MFS transporter [candidate division KSB1 bacterium]|nr:MFS transporter [candidate division KSB1 bacterium]